MNQYTLARSDLGRAMQHLVCRDVVENEADSLARVQGSRHWHEFTLRQAYVLRIRAEDRQRGDDLTWFDVRDPFTDPIHCANQIPSRREWQRRRLRMNALAHHDIGQGDTCGKHSHPHFAALRLW